MIINVKDKAYYIDGYLEKNLSYIKDRVINHSNMLVCIIDGRPGSGKSTLASQLAYYCSEGNVGLDCETFNEYQFKNQLNKAKFGDSIILDEAFEMLNARTTRSLNNMLSISLLQTARSKRVFIFILLPSFYDLDKNIILNLCDLFIHCYRQPFGDRGQFKVYNLDGIKKLYIWGKDYRSYSEKIAKPNFFGRFTKFFPFDHTLYEKKKQDTIANRNEEVSLGSAKYLEQRNILIKKLSEYMSVKEIMALTKMSQTVIYETINKEKHKKNNLMANLDFSQDSDLEHSEDQVEKV